MTGQTDPIDRGNDGTEPPVQAGDTVESATAVDPLERRYRQLLRAYPAGYRAERADELVGTYLELLDRDRRWPSPGDAADVLRGGLRQRLRQHGALGLAAGLPVAATIALGTLVALAVFLLVHVEFGTVAYLNRLGPFQTLGAVGWFGWLLAGLAATLAPAGWARRTVLAVLLLTLAVVPTAAIAGSPRPPLYVLVPTVALGLMALALPDDPGWLRRAVPLLGAGTGAGGAALFAAAEGGGDWFTSYGSVPEILAMTGGLVFGLALLVGIGRATRGDDSGLWAALLLITPAGLLGIRPIAEVYWTRYGALPWTDLASASIVVTLLGMGVLLVAIAGQASRHRAALRRSGAGPCPLCGRLPAAAPRADGAAPDTVS